MEILHYSLLAFLSVVGILLYFGLRKYNKYNSKKFFRTIAIVLAVVFYARYMLGYDAIGEIFALRFRGGMEPFWNLVSLLLNWFLNASVLLIVVGEFFDNKTVKNIIRFFSLPAIILSIIFAMPVAIGIVGKWGYARYNYRVFLMIVEMVLALVYAFATFWENGKFKITKPEAKKLFWIIPMLLATMQSYVICGIFGNAPIKEQLKDLSMLHRFVLYIGAILPVIIYFVLRKKDKNTIKLCMLYIAIGTMTSFLFRFKIPEFRDPTNLPFHLCHTAMFLVPLCLIFKWEKLFYFTYFINVFGAFVAMAMPNYSAGLDMFSQEVVLFYINHYCAFFMPILMVGLGIYGRPNLKLFLYSLVGFAAYYIFILIINAWFTNYGEVDFFFTNSDFITDKLGALGDSMRDATLEFDLFSLHFKFFPIFQVLYFFGYSLLGLAVWFVYEWAYSGTDLLKEIAERKKKIKLDTLALMMERAEIAGDKKAMEKIQLELKNFSKKYGSNKHYSVKDANLVVNGGEIFGFLGPNGAGKSTIIKSVVGIQPITSGRIEVCGYDVEKESTRAKSEIGFVPDHYALYENLTGREYINYIADLYKVSQADREKRIEKYVKLFELEHAFDNQMKTYSHGMKQKIAIMSALVHNPKIWILDEPLTGLDPNSIFQVKECMKQHAKEGNVVFFSSHIIDVVERICDRIAIIKKGEIQVCKTVQEIEENGTLEDFYMNIINGKGEKE